MNPSGKLPLTFPRSDNDLPHPSIVKPPKGSEPDPGEPGGWEKILHGLKAFQVTYDEGVKVGYKWYDAEHKQVLFPFGHGLSYTTYSYSNLKVTLGKNVRLDFTVANTGSRAGAEIGEVYAALPSSAGEPPQAACGFQQGQAEPR